MSGRGSVYKRAATWTAHVKWQHEGEWKQRKKGGYRRRQDAEQALTEMLKAVDVGEAVPVDQITVDQFHEQWLDHLAVVVGRSPSTVAGYRSKLRCYVSPVIGGDRMQATTATRVDAIFRDMSRRGLKARTIRQLYAILRHSFGDAVKQGVIAANVIERTTPPSTVASRAPKFPVWSDAELDRFLEHIDGHAHAAAITFAAVTGCRRSEVVGLRWSDLDLDDNRATLAQSVTEADGALVVGDTKDHKAHPIALSDELVAVLRRHRTAQTEWRLQVGPYWVDRDLVFPGPDGDYMKPGTLSQQFDRLVATSGLQKVRFHDLRHGVGTTWARSFGAEVAQRQLGHATVAFTIDNYVHVSTDELVAAANEVGRRRKEAR